MNRHPEEAFAQPAEVRVITRCPLGCALGHVVESRWPDPSAPGLLVWQVVKEHYDEEGQTQSLRAADRERLAMADDGATPVVLIDRLATQGDSANIVAACKRHQKLYAFSVRDLQAKAATKSRSPVVAKGVETG